MSLSKSDIVVVGCGIAGVGVAKEALRRGFSVTVLEKAESLSGTSNNALRIIHGGFRYLQNLNFLRVFRSVQDQRDLLEMYPDYITPLVCALPLKSVGLKSKYPAWVAGMSYGAILKLKNSSLPAPRIASRVEMTTLAESLVGNFPLGALIWTDAVVTDPPAFGRKLISELRSRGGEVVENCRISSVTCNKDGLFESRDSEGRAYISKVVINTAGAGIGSINPERSRRAKSGWCKAFNIVIARQFNTALGVALPSFDGRMFFMVPRDSGTAIGTWYEPLSEPQDQPSVSEVELDRFIHEINRVLPAQPIARSEVLNVEVGQLPMIGVKDGEPELLDSEVITEDRGYFEVLSTKYTTFLSLGRKVIHRAERYL